MNYTETAERLKTYRGQIETLRQEMRANARQKVAAGV